MSHNLMCNVDIIVPNNWKYSTCMQQHLSPIAQHIDLKCSITNSPTPNTGFRYASSVAIATQPYLNFKYFLYKMAKNS